MQPKTPSNPGRRKFLIAATSIVGTGAVIGAAIPFVAAFNPSAQAILMPIGKEASFALVMDPNLI